MRKKVIALTLASIVGLSASAMAAVPSSDENSSIGYSWHKFSVKDSDWSENSEKMSANQFYGSIHLTGKWFLNGDYLTFNGKQPSAVGSANLKNTYYAGDVQYNLNKNVGLLVGYGKFERKFSPIGLPSGTMSSSGIYGGVVASTDLGGGFTAYTVGKVGTKINDWTVGLGYNINKDTMLDVSYRYIKAKQLEGSGIANLDVEAKGLGVGLTYKF